MARLAASVHAGNLCILRVRTVSRHPPRSLYKKDRRAMDERWIPGMVHRCWSMERRIIRLSPLRSFNTDRRVYPSLAFASFGLPSRSGRLNNSSPNLDASYCLCGLARQGCIRRNVTKSLRSAWRTWMVGQDSPSFRRRRASIVTPIEGRRI